MQSNRARTKASVAWAQKSEASIMANPPVLSPSASLAGPPRHAASSPVLNCQPSTFRWLT